MLNPKENWENLKVFNQQNLKSVPPQVFLLQNSHAPHHSYKEGHMIV